MRGIRWIESAEPPERVLRDWLVVMALTISAVVETVLRTDLRWPAFALATVGVLIVATLWRRSSPLAATITAFGAVSLLDAAALIEGIPSELLFTGAAMVLFPYALGRWGSVPQGVAGMILVLANHGLRAVVDGDSLLGAMVQTSVLLLPFVVGMVVRLSAVNRDRERDQIRSAERERLARDLHDTVAHHVSAIAIQAEVGMALAEAGRSEDVAQTLDAISNQASATLSEMRSIVGALRVDTIDAQPGERMPYGPIEQVRALASDGDTGPRIDVALGSDLESVGPSVGTAVYRISQEAVTNAVRHGRGVTRIAIEVTRRADLVVVRVSDDGRQQPARRQHSAKQAQPGFGLLGMTERVSILGGTLTAGPDSAGGWVVKAALPI